MKDTVSSPFEAVDKMMPDRSISAEKRIVHDQRGVNHFTDKVWHPPALQPTHDQIARRILWMQARYPGVPVLLAKKDIAGAFRLLWVNPADAPLFAGDLPWKPEFAEDGHEEGRKEEGKPMTVIYLVSSFGFSGPPGEWTPWQERGPRVNVHGMAGPLKWPLRCSGSQCFEESIVYDRCGAPGRVHQLSPLEVWWCQGRDTKEWRKVLEKCENEDEAKEEGCRATGVQTAQTLLVAATSLYRGGGRSNNEKAGAVRDFQDESLARLLLWLRRWRKGDFGRDRGAEERRAGGNAVNCVSRYAEAMWIEAMDELENYIFVEIYAGGRRKRANAEEERGNSLVGQQVCEMLPFDGGVSLRIDEWLEANMQGDKAESTSKQYHSSWQKWVAWARRQA